MNLSDIVNRLPKPEPWSEGEKIPWNEPEFSARMLKEHLSQDHDAASRRFVTIDCQVAWIHETLLGSVPTSVLDLGCGPGLYTSRLARLGHTCTGIDFSPASIGYAQAEAGRERLACAYQLADVRQADYGRGHGLAMFIFGELNVFKPEDARGILSKASQALAPGGVLLLEPHTYATVETMGHEPRSWYSSPSGLFSERPHIVLSENIWLDELDIAMTRHYAVDAGTGEVMRHAQTMQAYTDAGYRDLLSECGFADVGFCPSLTGAAGENDYGLMVIVGRKPTEGSEDGE
jgi:SAM-dependent methyltransferase